MFGGNPAVAGASPCFSQELFPTFAKPDETEFFSKESALQFFDLLQQTGFSKSPKGIYNFGIVSFFKTNIFVLKFVCVSVDQHSFCFQLW